ncbi:MAG: PAAR domain-containing protein [Labilibaculum sp.]|nr:PAAR domain-containing protein [Labilibaculum sp.]MBI9058547.1 PAAR domain-containing protein [Labilibaculum sp.]
MPKKPIITLGSMHVCPMCSGTIPHVGGPVAGPGQANVLINGKPVATLGDICTCCGPPDTIAQGEPVVLINGLPVATVGCLTAHGGTLIQGEPNVTITTSASSKKSTAKIKDIPFPEITTFDVIGSMIKGTSKDLQKAKENIEELKKEAQEQDTGEEEEKQLPKLQGEIIFVNGYLSESLGGILNALLDINPDSKKYFSNLSRGHNVDEENHINDDDILTADELEAINNMTDAEKLEDSFSIPYVKLGESREATVPFPIGLSPVPNFMPCKIKYPTFQIGKLGIDLPNVIKPIPKLTKVELKEVFYGYWNQLGNGNSASKVYADYFNATGREHFINGSHGLGSNAAHRLDHGIALGYHWAKYNWKIKTKKEVDAQKSEKPQIESLSPAYKPITIVMHSQGNAPGAGVALGVLKYAKEQGWDKVPLNMIYLGVHQPTNLCDDEYERFINNKVKYYGVDKNFWNAAVWTPFLRKDKKVLKFFNSMSDLFNPKYHKLHHRRGIYEHLKDLNVFEQLKERSVQFTFANDRGDLVIRDGDIPEIDSACNPDRDNSLYSVEFLRNGEVDDNKSNSVKKTVPIKDEGNLLIPAYSAVPRLFVEEKDGVVIKEYWDDYNSVATDFGNAAAKFVSLQKKFKFTYKDILSPIGRKTKQAIEIYISHKQMLYHYGRIQEADLYAHFSPVEFIMDGDILKHSDFDDKLGQGSIWERIKKMGENKFYRVEYGDEGEKEKVPDDEIRRKAKEYINDTENEQKLISTAIADTFYVKNVINAFVDGDEGAEEELYEEKAVNSRYKEIERLQKLFGEDVVNQINKDLVDEMIMQQDKTRVDKPKIIKP